MDALDRDDLDAPAGRTAHRSPFTVHLEQRVDGEDVAGVEVEGQAHGAARAVGQLLPLGEGDAPEEAAAVGVEHLEELLEARQVEV